MTASERSGRVDYVPEGYRVTWSETGLVVEATDYHAGKLNLTWEKVFDLAERAGQAAQKKCKMQKLNSEITLISSIDLRMEK